MILSCGGVPCDEVYASFGIMVIDAEWETVAQGAIGSLMLFPTIYPVMLRLVALSRTFTTKGTWSRYAITLIACFFAYVYFAIANGVLNGLYANVVLYGGAWWYLSAVYTLILLPWNFFLFGTPALVLE